MKPEFDRDLFLISRRFLDDSLPKEKEYLYHYFKTYVQQIFVRYYYEVGRTDYFFQHTGVYACTRWLKKLRKRYAYIEDAYEKAKEEGDFETISLIKSGEHPVPLTNPERRAKGYKNE